MLVITDARLSHVEGQILPSQVKEDNYIMWSSDKMWLAMENSTSSRQWNTAKVATHPHLQNTTIEGPV
jgi:hypothetical protein